MDDILNTVLYEDEGEDVELEQVNDLGEINQDDLEELDIDNLENLGEITAEELEELEKDLEVNGNLRKENLKKSDRDLEEGEEEENIKEESSHTRERFVNEKPVENKEEKEDGEIESNTASNLRFSGPKGNRFRPGRPRPDYSQSFIYPQMSPNMRPNFKPQTFQNYGFHPNFPQANKPHPTNFRPMGANGSLPLPSPNPTKQFHPVRIQNPRQNYQHPSPSVPHLRGNVLSQEQLQFPIRPPFRPPHPVFTHPQDHLLNPSNPLKRQLPQENDFQARKKMSSTLNPNAIPFNSNQRPLPNLNPNPNFNLIPSPRPNPVINAHSRQNSYLHSNPNINLPYPKLNPKTLPLPIPPPKSNPTDSNITKKIPSPSPSTLNSLSNSVPAKNSSTKRELIIENLSPETSNQALTELFSKVGPVSSIRLNKQNNSARIVFQDSNHATISRRQLNRTLFQGSLITVSFPSS